MRNIWLQVDVWQKGGESQTGIVKRYHPLETLLLLQKPLSLEIKIHSGQPVSGTRYNQQAYLYEVILPT